MSATRRPLLDISEVIDHDCGMYRIGEIDFGINGRLKSYLKEYGAEGKKELIQALGYLTYEVEREFQTLSVHEQQCQAST